MANFYLADLQWIAKKLQKNRKKSRENVWRLKKVRTFALGFNNNSFN